MAWIEAWIDRGVDIEAWIGARLGGRYRRAGRQRIGRPGRSVGGGGAFRVSCRYRALQRCVQIATSMSSARVEWDWPRAHAARPSHATRSRRTAPGGRLVQIEQINDVCLGRGVKLSKPMHSHTITSNDHSYSSTYGAGRAVAELGSRNQEGSSVRNSKDGSLACCVPERYPPTQPFLCASARSR